MPNPGSPIFGTRQYHPNYRWADWLVGLGICVTVGCHQQATSASTPPPNHPAPRPALAAAASSANPVAVTPTPTPTPTTADVAAPSHGAEIEAEWTELPLPGFEPAVLWHRPSAPLFVVTHGAGGQAEWHCQHFHRLLAGRATLLCPRGKLRYAGDPSQGYYYPDHFALRREVLVAIERFEALESAAPNSGAARPYVYAGYSQGATMGALAFAEQGQLFSQLLLVEGGFAEWSNGLVAQYQRSGGQAVLFVCGTQHCNVAARAAVERLKSAGVRSKVDRANGAGHIADGAVGRALAKALPFLLDTDPRWQGFTPVIAD